MVTILSLWLPMLVGAVLVFIASSVIHMLLPYHRNDFQQLPDEEAARAAWKGLNVPPGDYIMPFAGGPEAMRSEEFMAKVDEGPLATITVLPPETWKSMGPQLTQWFAYSVVVSFFTAYVASATLAAGAEYLSVFQVTGATAFACYAMALPQRSIWYKQNWPATLKSMFDGLVYAAVTAGAFGMLWPA